MSKTITLIVRQWGDELAVCIPADLASAAQLVAGQAVEVTLRRPESSGEHDDSATLTLEQKLSRYDPQQHGGEVMADVPVGAEVIK